ncbi:MAG: o-succinylbenzoate synthase [Muribaculaceae bacterium]|nr:o-succinylbenzoate synthase [Muribaculaceae bacterium]
MLQADYCTYRLRFLFEARTSRETMRTKDTYLVRLYDTDQPTETLATGECALFRGLSADDCPDYEDELRRCCLNPSAACDSPYSSIRFGFEQLLRPTHSAEWRNGSMSIPINGLIWMGDKRTMASRIAEKLDSGFRVLKLKIGGIRFEDELDLIREVRRRFAPSDLEIRLDANGSFSADVASERLSQLEPFAIHSLEQPVKAGQPEAMRLICRTSPIAIALDEELIGVRDESQSRELVEYIRPQYLILKPALCGGFAAADTYINIARDFDIGWWATSALESNVGLSAIAEWVAAKRPAIPQGLGTGLLYDNNFESPLFMEAGSLRYNPEHGDININELAWISPNS